MGWEVFLDAEKEALISVLNHRKGRIFTTIGMTDHRSFYYNQYKQNEEFVSSKLPITTIQYYRKWLPIWVWVALGLIAALFWTSAIYMYFYISLMFILIPIALIAIALYLRNMWILTTVIGTKSVSLKSRRDIPNVVEFIRKVHSQTDLASKGFSSFGTETGNKKLMKYGGILFGVIILYYVLLIIF